MNGYGVPAALAGAMLAACVSSPAPAPLDPSSTAAQFAARRLDALSPDLPAPMAGWDRSQWLAAALQLNPQLAEARARVAISVAAERTAAERPNPTMDLFAEYATVAANSAAWLYGVSMDFLLRRPGERARATHAAALQTAIAQSELAESIWQVRAALRQALLDAVAARDETALLESLIAQRQGLLESDRTRARAGDIGRTEVLGDELELSRAQQRLRQSQARGVGALARLAAAVGVPVSALDAVPLRWDDWASIDALTIAPSDDWRGEALIARPQIVQALREYELAQLSLQTEVAKRWPDVHLTPGYAWGGNGVREDPLIDFAYESALGVSFEVPLFNRHQGRIGEALARRSAAGEHLKAAQAQIFGQIDRAELTWPPVRQAWQETQSVAAIAARQEQTQQRALAAGAADRAGLLSAQIAATEARLTVLQAAYAAQVSFGELEDAYRRPLQGAECQWRPGAASQS